MNIPAYTSPTLCLGRTYDAETSTACSDIFPADIPKKRINVSTFSFKYKVVKSNKEVNDLLDVSGELSLKIKAGLIEVKGSGQYVNENKTEEGTASLLAVMKCTTVVETIDGPVQSRSDLASGEFLEGIGSHYVRSVTYGVEMVANLKFKSSADSKKTNIQGEAEGKLQMGVVDAGLKAQLNMLSTECNDLSDMTIEYYATDLPDKLPTTLEELVKLIEDFPTRLKNINDGDGIPVQFELRPTRDVIPTAKVYLQNTAATHLMEELENCFDDLRTAQTLTKAYVQSDQKLDDDVQVFISETNKTSRVFRSAISSLGTNESPKQIRDCLGAYQKALDGKDIGGKFVRRWKEILRTKVPISSLKLPQGDPLVIVLLGKTGNGKSASGNTIIGEERFEDSPSGESMTQVCTMQRRREERDVSVIDTPGIMDTAPVSALAKMKASVRYNQSQEQIIRELHRMFVLSPNGLDAIILTIKYGGRFTLEDAEALKMLQSFLGEEANAHMILLFTHGDQAARDAKKKKRSVEDHLKWYIETLPEWVQVFLKEIGDRRILFNNVLDPDEDPDGCKRQVIELIKMIDGLKKEKGSRFIHKLTKASKEALDEEIKKAMEKSGFYLQFQELARKERELEKQLADKKKSAEEKAKLKKLLAQEKKKRKDLEDQEAKLKDEVEEARQDAEKANDALKRVENESGGCYPESAFVTDKHGKRRRMDSLEIGEEVQVVNNNEIQFQPVITFIHRQQGLMQEFVQITTLKGKVLKITEDHLLFVEKMGEARAIPARDVKIGDVVYVRACQSVESDQVHSISTVFEKGAYAPVTLSGTILVDDVHTSCYFDVLSHDWSQRAMGIARAVYHISPGMLQWLSSIGQQDGFPGWCRLVQKATTFMD